MQTHNAHIDSSRYILVAGSSSSGSKKKLLLSMMMMMMMMMMKQPGPGCSKLTTSLVNISLKFQTLISEIC